MTYTPHDTLSGFSGAGQCVPTRQDVLVGGVRSWPPRHVVYYGHYVYINLWLISGRGTVLPYEYTVVTVPGHDPPTTTRLACTHTSCVSWWWRSHVLHVPTAPRLTLRVTTRSVGLGGGDMADLRLLPF